MTMFQRYAESLYAEFQKAVAAASQEARVPEPAAFAELRHQLRQLLQLPASEADMRSALWRARVRLYDARASNDVIADSDPEAAADAPGAQICSGLPGVAVFLRDLATQYHTAAGHGDVEGLDEPTLKHKLKALRPTLSRRGGNGAWRVHYATIPTDIDRTFMTVMAQKRAWIARVDVERV